MKPGEGAGYALGDIANGVAIELIRQRWRDGEYGEPHERPTPEAMKSWLKWAGRT